eukprot:5020025-Amphidinium_carterae.1
MKQTPKFIKNLLESMLPQLTLGTVPGRSRVPGMHQKIDRYALAEERAPRHCDLKQLQKCLEKEHDNDAWESFARDSCHFLASVVAHLW